MPYHRHLIGLFTFLISALSTAPATALPIIFTDRAAFNAAVGDTTLLTFDTLPAVTPDNLIGRMTIDSILTIQGDLGGFAFYDSKPGTFCFCYPGLTIGAATIDPVLAFGVDITPLRPNTTITLGGLSFALSAPQFLGFLFGAPSSFEIGQTFTPANGYSTFTIDNVAVKSVPEPSSLGLIAFSVFGLYGGRKIIAYVSHAMK
jgi:PEP-CTERM motif